MKGWLLLFIFICPALYSQDLVTRDVATGFDTPWEILWGPDNHIWMTERIGNINRVNPETGAVQQLITISEVFEGGERGLMGLALHPDFPATPLVYAGFTYGSSTTTVKVVSYEYNGSGLVNQRTIIDNIAGSSTHDGCRLFISGDKLFITTGDAQQLSRPQDPSSKNGKILRLNLDGSIPTDNPISGNPLWSLGHRNPQGLVIINGIIYSSEHGPNNDDEVNLIQKNGNYGWPDVEGFCDDPGELNFCQQNSVKEPMRAWTPTLAVAGLDYYNAPLIPRFRNSLLMVSLKAGRLTQLKLNESGTAITEELTIYDNNFGRLRDLCVAPDGRVFFATSNRDGRGSPKPGDDRIIEIKPEGTVVPTETLEGSIVIPNPVDSGRNGNVNFPFPGNYDLKVYDLKGKKLLESSVTNARSAKLATSALPAGVYVLVISSGESEAVKKFVIR